MVRPLLQAHKHELLEYCQLHSLPYVTDPTNKDLSFQRNRIRWLLANVPYSSEAEVEEAASCADGARGSSGNYSSESGKEQPSSSIRGSMFEQREKAAAWAHDPQVPPVVRDILRLQRACAEAAALLTQQSNCLLRQVVLHTSAPDLPNKRQADERRWWRMEQQQGQQQRQLGSSKGQQIGSRWEHQKQETNQHPSATQEPEWLGVHWPTVLPRLASELSAFGLLYSLVRLPRLAGAEDPIAEAALSRVLQATCGADYPPSTADVARLWERLRGGTLVGAYTGGGCLVRPVPRSKGRYALVVPQAEQVAAEELMRSVVRAGTVKKGSKSNSSGGCRTVQPADMTEEAAAESLLH